MNKLDKTDIYILLDKLNIWYRSVEHKAVYTMSEAAETVSPFPEAGAKNLFIRDDKKQNYYLITVKGDKRVDLKVFRRKYNTRALCFASATDLENIMGLIPGAVTPFGLLNDKSCMVRMFIDKEFMKEPGIIGVHPNDNTASVYMKTTDLITLIKNHGNEVIITDI